jgi:hypothetical protein
MKSSLDRIWLYLAKTTLKLLENFTPFYLSLTTREKYFDIRSLKRFRIFANVNDDFAIVMQGPIITKNNFTIETLNLYRHIYPNVSIVYSTWAGTITIEDKKKLNIINVTIIENKLPENRGVSNINLQIKSTSSGLHLLNEQGRKHVLKVRSDQRIYNNVDFLTYMKVLQSLYPVKNSQINERLVICSINTFKERLYGITDMLMFGKIEDMILYWDVPLENLSTASNSYYSDPKYFIKNFLGEGYFLKYFFEKVNLDPKWTTKDSDDFIKDYFVIVDKEQIDLFWFKYNRFFESMNILNIDDFNFRRRYNYVDWIINFYSSITNK